MDQVFENDNGLQAELLRLATPDYNSIPNGTRRNRDALRQHYASAIARNIWAFALTEQIQYDAEDGTAQYCQNRGGVTAQSFALTNFVCNNPRRNYYRRCNYSDLVGLVHLAFKANGRMPRVQANQDPPLVCWYPS
jgi:hypothetical protein